MAKKKTCPFCLKRISQMIFNDHIRDTADHGQISGPNICLYCPRSYPTEDALVEHVRSFHAGIIKEKEDVAGAETDEVKCRICNVVLKNGADLWQHRLLMHNWCSLCSRNFVSWSALSHHMSSLAHAPRKHDCPFCEKAFKSPSGVAHHIESGRHKLTRHQVTAAVQAMDIVPKITTKHIEAPPDVHALPTIVTYIATSDTFNGKSNTCFLCGDTFWTLPSLNRHLNSAAHDDNEFRCPKCKAEFTLVSGFVQHLESRTCGLAKNKQVEDHYNGLVDQISGLLKM